MGNVQLQNPDVVGHHEDYGVQGMRLNGNMLEVSLVRACYDTVEEPVVVLGSPMLDGNGQPMTQFTPYPSQCVWGWPTGHARIITPEGEYVGNANGSGRVDIDVSQAPESFWTRVDPSMLELPGVAYPLQLQLNSSVQQAALSRAAEGAAALELSLTFNDGASNNDGRLDPGETASLTYTVVNVGTAPAGDVLLNVNFESTTGIMLAVPVDLGAVGPGEARTGEVPIHSPATLSQTALVFEGVAEDVAGESTSDRLVVPVAIDNTPDRAWIWYDDSGRHRDLLPAGAARLQSVLTSAGRYVFVSDEATRQRIQGAVDQGGGSAEDRFRLAVQAAGGEAIQHVFQLEINAMPGNDLQLVLAVYETSAGDRVFLSDATVPANGSAEVLSGFERLGQSYLSWLR